MVNKVRVTITGTYDLLPEHYPVGATPEAMVYIDENNKNLDEIGLLESLANIETKFELFKEASCTCKEVQTGYQGDPDFHIEHCSLHKNAGDLLDLAKQTLDVIRLIDEGKPVPLGYFRAKVAAAISRVENPCE